VTLTLDRVIWHTSNAAAAIIQSPAHTSW